MIYMTNTISEAVKESPDMLRDVSSAIERFNRMDFGNICKEDIQANIRDLQLGGGALGKYPTVKGDIYIDTANGVDIVIMFPYEY